MAANIAALQRAQKPAAVVDVADLDVLSSWVGWGGLPRVFDEQVTTGAYAQARATLQQLVSPQDYDSMRRSTINAHYTTPQIAMAMWDAAARLGFDGGAVLEPGAGIGVFAATAPPSAQLTAIEKDPTTASILALLQPDVEVVAAPFEEFHPSGRFAAAIGNVPFANVKPYDRRFAVDLSLHNFCIAKSLSLVQEDGLVLAITSQHTLDAVTGLPQRELASWGQFVGAVRLPEESFAANAATQVTTDIVIYRSFGRRLDEPSPHPGVDEIAGMFGRWQSAWYLDNPHLVLGQYEPGRISGQGKTVVSGLSGDELHQRIEQALGAALEAPYLASANRNRSTRSAASSGPAAAPKPQPWSPPGWAKEGSLFMTSPTTGPTMQIRDGVPVDTGMKHAKERWAILAVRDALMDLLAAETATSDGDCAVERQHLNNTYRTYRDKYGPITRYTITSAGHRRYPQMGKVRTFDPDYPSLLALETEQDDGTVALATIFKRRVVRPPAPPLQTNNVAEAVTHSLARTGTIDLDVIGVALGRTVDSAELGGHAFADPANGAALVPASRYLSGNIRAKLAVATAAAETDSAYQANVAALAKAMPRQLHPDQIEVRLGAAWVPPQLVAQWFERLLGGEGRLRATYTPVTGWLVDQASTGMSGRYLTHEQWGTNAVPFDKLVTKLLTGQRLTVYRTDADDRRVLDMEATLELNAKAEELHDNFSEWLLGTDTERSTQVADAYNHLYSSHAASRTSGDWINPPGLADGIELHQHQREAVERILIDGRLLLAHVVGAGKTGVMGTAAIEGKRIGRFAKPAIVVPNHLLEQVTAETKKWFPTAKVLMPTKAETTKAGRKEFAAKCAVGDWDLIALPESLFARLSVPRHVEIGYINDQLDELQDALKLVDGRSKSVKQIVKIEDRYKARLQKLQDTERDDGVTWDQLGVDALFVDEAHRYKNLTVASTRPELLGDGSKRATDFELKLNMLRDARGDMAGVVLATGTPVANKTSEAYVMARYVQPDVLQESGTYAFDAWVAQYGKLESAIELKATGDGFRSVERFKAYQNVHDLMRLLSLNADVRLAEDLDLDRPALAGEKRQIMAVPATDALADHMASLAQRAQQLGYASRPGEDNMLKIMGHGIKAALDLDLLAPGTQPDPCKVGQAADLIAQITRATADTIYIGRDGNPSPTPGALQLVFCDLGVPGAPGSVYEKLADNLIARDVDPAKIAFIHDATDARTKAQLMERCRTGVIQVLIGSTEKLGTGMNVQDRLIALHHLDAPWRPADVEQREGRILRPGNQNPKVSIYTWITEGSLDAYKWQILENKARFITQLWAARHQRPDAGFAQTDVLAQDLGFAEIKAAAIGSPELIELGETQTQLMQLTALKSAHDRNQRAAIRRQQNAEHTITEQQAKLKALKALELAAADLDGDQLLAALGQTRHRFIQHIADIPRHGLLTLGTINARSTTNYRLDVEQRNSTLRYTIRSASQPRNSSPLIAYDSSPDHNINTLPERIAAAMGRLDKPKHNCQRLLKKATADATADTTKTPFPQQAALDGLQAKATRLQAIIDAERGITNEAIEPEPASI